MGVHIYYDLLKDALKQIQGCNAGVVLFYAWKSTFVLRFSSSARITHRLVIVK